MKWNGNADGSWVQVKMDTEDCRKYRELKKSKFSKKNPNFQKIHQKKNGLPIQRDKPLYFLYKIIINNKVGSRPRGIFYFLYNKVTQANRGIFYFLYNKLTQANRWIFYFLYNTVTQANRFFPKLSL